MKKYQHIIDKIRQLFNEPSAFIPLHAPVFNGNEKKYLNECIDSTFVSSVGKFVDQFEEKMAEFTGAKKAVVCVNGTNALHLALQMVGVQREDEVITQALTFIATANAISYAGAHPVFLDVDRDTMGLSPEKLEKWLSENVELRETEVKVEAEVETKNEVETETEVKSSQPKSKPKSKPEPEPKPFNKKTGRRIAACVPMHTFGHPCRMDKLMEVCNKYNIPVVEDAAESIGSYYKGKHTGTFGEIGVLSFNGNKTITTGGGGMLLFNDEALAAKVKHLTTQAKVPHPWEFRHDDIGYNYRMPNLNAAVGLAQLEQLPKFLAAKRQLAKQYNNFFKTSTSTSTSTSTFVKEPENSQSSYWLNAILLENRAERDLFLKETNEADVMTRPIWELMTELPMFQHCQKDDLIVSRELADRVVNIPSSVRA